MIISVVALFFWAAKRLNRPRRLLAIPATSLSSCRVYRALFIPVDGVSKALVSLLILVGVSSGCQHVPPPTKTQLPDERDDPSVLAPTVSYRIGAFNLHHFGPARVDDPLAMALLTTILARYDLVVLMEIRDISGRAPSELLAQLNATASHSYDLLLSSRLGRKGYKEQYGILYRPDRVALSDVYEYDDGLEPNSDLFSREPLVVYADFGGLTLSLIVLHADPQAVALELNRLLPVYQEAALRRGDDDAIILGDLNADCSFLPKKDKPFVKLLSDNHFVWLLGDEVDTTVRDSTDCAYDRIIVTKTLLGYIGEGAVVYDFPVALELDEAQALAVSDHKPVELVITSGE